MLCYVNDTMSPFPTGESLANASMRLRWLRSDPISSRLTVQKTESGVYSTIDAKQYHKLHKSLTPHPPASNHCSK